MTMTRNESSITSLDHPNISFAVRFSINRIDFLESDRFPYVLPVGPRLVVHLVPKTANVDNVLSLNKLHSVLTVPSLSRDANDLRGNVDGTIALAGTYTDNNNSKSISGFSQLFFNGALESVLPLKVDNQLGISLQYIENRIEAMVAGFRDLQARLSFVGDFDCIVTLLGVKEVGANLAARRCLHDGIFDRDIVRIPPVELKNNPSDDAGLIFVFEHVWNACSLRRPLEKAR